MAVNFKHLIKDELVNRFEDLMKEQMREHYAALENHHSTIEDIRENHSELDKKVNSIKVSQNEQMIRLENNLNRKHEEIETTIIEQRKFIKYLLEDAFKEVREFKVCLTEYVRKEEFDKETEDKYRFNKNIRIELNENSNYFNTLVVNSGIELKKILDFKFKTASDAIETLCTRLNHSIEESKTNKIDATGILRELQVYKKTVFVIEKKIENIYKKLEKLESKVGV